MATSRSFTFTVRPTNGLSKKSQKELIDWLSKQPYAFAVIEMEGLPGRHMHGQVWLNKPKLKKFVTQGVGRVMKRTVKDWCRAQQSVMSSGVIMAWSDDWVDNYLVDNPLKDEPVQIVYDHRPAETEEFYPTKEEQEAFQEKKHSVDKKFCHWKLLWLDWIKEQDFPNPQLIYTTKPKEWMVSLFMQDAQYKSKTIRVMKDKRTQNTNITHLWKYIGGYVTHNSERLKEQEKVWRENNMTSM